MHSDATSLTASQGALNVTVSDLCYVTCPMTRIKVILHYVEEGWLGRTQNKVQGVVFRYDPDHDTRTRIKDVPDKDILVKIEGCWQDKIYFTLPKSSVRRRANRMLTPKLILPRRNTFSSTSTRYSPSRRWSRQKNSNCQTRAAGSGTTSPRPSRHESTARRRRSNSSWRSDSERRRTSARPRMTNGSRGSLQGS